VYPPAVSWDDVSYCRLPLLLLLLLLQCRPAPPVNSLIGRVCCADRCSAPAVHRLLTGLSSAPLCPLQCGHSVRARARACVSTVGGGPAWTWTGVDEADAGCRDCSRLTMLQRVDRR